MRDCLLRTLTEAESLLGQFRGDAACLDALSQAGMAIAGAFRSGNKVLAAGNGGSLADAVHFAEEWTGRFRNNRKPYPAIALSDSSAMSCIANDFGYDHVFSRQVEALAKSGDILLLLSTSGLSSNVLHAARAGRKIGMTILGFVGQGGGELGKMSDIVIHAPGSTADRIQELHMLALHALIEAVEVELGEA
jgi:D-sedoheptulose 7-phosphate isomerase